MSTVSGLISRFPLRELSIRRLFSQSADFQAVCADYEEALAAMRHWQTTNCDAKVKEYGDFLSELELEIIRMLDVSAEMKP